MRGGVWSYSPIHSHLTTVLEIDGDEQPTNTAGSAPGVRSDEAQCALQTFRALSIKGTPSPAKESKPNSSVVRTDLYSLHILEGPRGGVKGTNLLSLTSALDGC
jgi:hypothetical protein